MARRAIDRPFETGIAKTATAATRQHNALSDLGQVGKQGFIVLGENLCTNGHAQNLVGAVGTGAVAPHAMCAGAGFEMLLVAIVDQRVQPVHALGNDIAAAATISAIGSAKFDIFFAPKTDTARAAVA